MTVLEVIISLVIGFSLVHRWWKRGEEPPIAATKPPSVVWRGSASDFVSDMRAVIPAERWPFLLACLGAPTRSPLSEADARRIAHACFAFNVGEDRQHDPPTHGMEDTLVAALCAVSAGELPPSTGGDWVDIFAIYWPAPPSAPPVSVRRACSVGRT